ncbi:uncharacterized protein LOC117188651 isoform X2 [Drosophila miranda]|uniref:uncharacterized protein LOC117188651 isoform X2 n=1 Tax=Drosophila miranda TaxID=7229 RepID=UPI00143F5F42|nr:uncharacterized protein LOC117188651 isoform X2 [Drosophila miranda]
MLRSPSFSRPEYLFRARGHRYAIIYQGLYPSGLQVHMRKCALEIGCPLQAPDRLHCELPASSCGLRHPGHNSSRARLWSWPWATFGLSSPFDLSIDNKDFDFGNKGSDYAFQSCI